MYRRLKGFFAVAMAAAIGLAGQNVLAQGRHGGGPPPGRGNGGGRPQRQAPQRPQMQMPQRQQMQMRAPQRQMQRQPMQRQMMQRAPQMQRQMQRPMMQRAPMPARQPQRMQQMQRQQVFQRPPAIERRQNVGRGNPGIWAGRREQVRQQPQRPVVQPQIAQPRETRPWARAQERGNGWQIQPQVRQNMARQVPDQSRALQQMRIQRRGENGPQMRQGAPLAQMMRRYDLQGRQRMQETRDLQPRNGFVANTGSGRGTWAVQNPVDRWQQQQQQYGGLWNEGARFDRNYRNHDYRRDRYYRSSPGESFARNLLATFFYQPPLYQTFYYAPVQPYVLYEPDYYSYPGYVTGYYPTEYLNTEYFDYRLSYSPEYYDPYYTDGSYLSDPYYSEDPLYVDIYADSGTTDGFGLGDEFLRSMLSQAYMQGLYEGGIYAQQYGTSIAYTAYDPYADPYPEQDAAYLPYSTTCEQRRVFEQGYRMGYRDAVTGRDPYEARSMPVDLVTAILGSTLSFRS